MRKAFSPKKGPSGFFFDVKKVEFLPLKSFFVENHQFESDFNYSFSTKVWAFKSQNLVLQVGGGGQMAADLMNQTITKIDFRWDYGHFRADARSSTYYSSRRV